MSQGTELLGGLFDSPNGKKAMEHLINRFYSQPSYVKDCATEHVFYREGERNVVAYIVRQFEQHTGRTQPMKVIK